MEISEILSRPEEFRYQLLGRMRMDCDYYLNMAKDNKFLWALNSQDHIDIMKAIWNSFSNEGKPEWLTWEQILNYELLITK